MRPTAPFGTVLDVEVATGHSVSCRSPKLQMAIEAAAEHPLCAITRRLCPLGTYGPVAAFLSPMPAPWRRFVRLLVSQSQLTTVTI